MYLICWNVSLYLDLWGKLKKWSHENTHDLMKMIIFLTIIVFFYIKSAKNESRGISFAIKIYSKWPFSRMIQKVQWENSLSTKIADLWCKFVERVNVSMLLIKSAYSQHSPSPCFVDFTGCLIYKVYRWLLYGCDLVVHSRFYIVVCLNGLQRETRTQCIGVIVNNLFWVISFPSVTL